MSVGKKTEEKVQVESETEQEKNDEEETGETKQACCRNCLAKINKKRLVSKLFYFFYFSSFGALFPYLALYFKQLFISPRQLGILVSIRSSLQFIFTPIWGAFADKYQKSKCVLLIGLSFWFMTTVSIALVPSRETPTACYRINSISLYANGTSKSTIHSFLEPEVQSPDRVSARWVGDYLPWGLGFFRAFEPERAVTFKEVAFPHFKTHPTPEPIANSSRLFVGLLVITVIGIIFASPSQCLADTATIQLLGKDTHEYGKQAMWGSVGYGITAFVVGASVSGQKRYNPCSKEMNTNFIPCFYVYGVYMLCAICVATRFQYNYQSTKPVEGKSKPSILAGLKILKNPDYAFFMFVVYFCGTATGFIQTFLFWHLRELGGEQILFSLITITNSTAEVVMYLFSDKILSHIGHFKAIYLGLLCYALRFFYYSYCSKPWLILPIELIQGITTAAVWSSFVSYVGSKPGLASTLQGLVSGFYTGLGYATGGFVGGLMVHVFGSTTSFLVFGELSLIVLFLFILVNNIREDPEPLPFTVLKQTKDYVPKIDAKNIQQYNQADNDSENQNDNLGNQNDNLESQNDKNKIEESKEEEEEQRNQKEQNEKHSKNEKVD